MKNYADSVEDFFRVINPYTTQKYPATAYDGLYAIYVKFITEDWLKYFKREWHTRVYFLPVQKDPCRVLGYSLVCCDQRPPLGLTNRTQVRFNNWLKKNGFNYVLVQGDINRLLTCD